MTDLGGPMTKVITFQHDYGDWRSVPNYVVDKETPFEFFDREFDQCYSKVPEEYCCSFSVECDYISESNVLVTAYYCRPETDDDRSEKEHKEQYLAAKRKAVDLETFAILRDKYLVDPDFVWK